MITSFTGFESFRLPKDVFSFIAIPVLVVLFLATRSLESLRALTKDWEMLLVAVLGFAGLHTLFSNYPSHSLNAWLSILNFVLLYFVLRGISTPRFQGRVWTWTSVALAANAILTVLQYYGMFPLMLRPTGEILAGRLNPAGFVGDVNTGGFLFGFVALVLIGEVVRAANIGKRLLLGILLILNLLGLFYTQTLTAIGAFGACFLLWVLFHQWWLLRQGQRRAAFVFWGLLVAGLIGAGIIAANSGVTDRIKVVWEQVQEGDWNLATAGRQPVYWITWQMIKEDPWIGKGLNTFGRDFFHARASTEYGSQVNLIDQPGSFREAHNEYLQTWEEMGLLGILLLPALITVPLLHSARLLFREEDSERLYRLGIWSLSLIFVAISCLTFFPLRLSATAAFIMLLMAGLRSDQTKNQVAEIWEMSDRPLLSWNPRTALLAGILVIVIPAYQQIGWWLANHETGLAAFLVNQTTTGTYDNEQRRLFAGEALRRLNRAENWAGGFYEIYNLRGSAHMVLGNYREALENYRIAASNIPGPEVYTNLAAAHIARNELEPARNYLELALAYNPHYQKARQAREFLDSGH